MLKLTSTSQFQRIETDIAEAEFEDKIVLLHINNGEYYNFNTTASDLWRWLAKPHSIDQLVKRLTDKYDCSADACRPDICSWLTEAHQKRLIQEIL